jgi:hypothetical protein
MREAVRAEANATLGATDAPWLFFFKVSPPQPRARSPHTHTLSVATDRHPPAFRSLSRDIQRRLASVVASLTRGEGLLTSWAVLVCSGRSSTSGFQAPSS